jgi:hypothetical protein
MRFAELQTLIEHQRAKISFGTQKTAPAPEWINKAEERLNQPLPPSYKLFLENYAEVRFTAKRYIRFIVKNLKLFLAEILSSSIWPSSVLKR